MSARYRYYHGGDGWRFCYASDVSVECPVVANADARVGAAALALECDEAKLRRIMDRAHRASLRERGEDGRFTGRCAACGATLRHVGYAAWRERDKAPEDDPSGHRIAGRLGFAPPAEYGRRRHFDRKKDAIEWAREEARISRAIAAEEAAK